MATNSIAPFGFVTLSFKNKFIKYLLYSLAPSVLHYQLITKQSQLLIIWKTQPYYCSRPQNEYFQEHHFTHVIFLSSTSMFKDQFILYLEKKVKEWTCSLFTERS